MLNQHTSAEHLAVPNGSDLRQRSKLWTDPSLQALKVLSFERFKSLDAETLNNPGASLAIDPLFKAFQEIVLLTISSMSEMNSLGKGLPNDSMESIVDLLTRPSSRTAVLFGKEPGQGRKVLGYSLVILDKQDIPDLHEIPDVLKERRDVARAIRLFVHPDARIFGAHDSSTSVLLDAIAKKAKGKRMIGKVLVGPESLHPIWLEAQKALKLRGWEDSGLAAIHQIADPDGTTRALQFKWWTYPPETPAGTAALKSYLSYFETLDGAHRKRLAAPATYFNLNNGVYVCTNPRDSHDLASLLPGSFVIEAPLTGEPKRQIRRLDNLGTEPVRDRVDGFFDPDVLPDVLPADREKAKEALERLLEARAEQLKPGGYCVLSDAVAPEWREPVEVHLTLRDGKQAGARKSLSTGALFQEFLRCRNNSDRVDQLRSDNGNILRYRGPAGLFQHFSLIRTAGDFDKQALRNYCVLTQADIEDVAARVAKRRGLKIVSSAAQHDEAVYEASFLHRVSFRDAAGRALPYPATGYQLVVQKVTAGMQLTVESLDTTLRPTFIRIESHRGEDGSIVEQASRPNQTADIVPTFKHDGLRYVVVKTDYTRPICLTGSPTLDGSRYSGYSVEQVAGIVPGLIGDAAPGRDLISKILEDRASIPREAIRGDALLIKTFLPAEHLIDELVVSVALEVEPQPDLLIPGSAASNLHSKGVVKPIEIRRFLQACQMGETLNARIEAMVYEILLSNNEPLGPWIAGKQELLLQRNGPALIPAMEVLKRAADSFFKLEIGRAPTFLRIDAGKYAERAADGTVLAVTDPPLESVRPAPKDLSTNTAVVIPMIKLAGEDGVERKCVLIDLKRSPAAQKYFKSSLLATAPTFKLPVSIRSLDDLQRYLRLRLKSDFGLDVLRLWPAGGKYHDSPGITPDMIYPCFVEVDAKSACLSSLYAVALDDLIANRGLIRDGNLLTGALRAYHRFGASCQA